MKLMKRSLYILIPIVLFALLSYQFVTTNQQMIRIPGGTLTTIDPVTQQSKVVVVKEFSLDKNLVTVGEFEAFTQETGYKTQAEQFGNAAVFDEQTRQWTLVDGADFRYPQGRNKPKANADHPATQVSWNDAKAYATWKGKRLPTQWEWEHAAKNGEAKSEQYTWGKDLIVGGKYKANTWQGSFPVLNTVDDGYRFTSPVGKFGENKLGLTDMGGNVWQWCEDNIEAIGREKEVDPSMRKVLRGGSFLCDPAVCHGFVVTGRSSSTPESSLMHAGFRCARDL